LWAKNLAINQFNVLGLFVFVGSGAVDIINCIYNHANAIIGFFGLGGAIFLGTGYIGLNNVIVSSEFGLAFEAALGGDFCLMGEL